MATSAWEKSGLAELAASSVLTPGSMSPPPGLEKSDHHILTPPPGLKIRRPVTSPGKYPLGPMFPPPGLHGGLNLPTPPGLVLRHQAQPHIISATRTLLAPTLEEDPLRSIYREYFQARSECLAKELTWNGTFEQVDASFNSTHPTAAVPLKPPGIFEKVDTSSCLRGSNSTTPAKPPGILKRSGSTFSLASTAATATGDFEDDKRLECSPKRSSPLVLLQQQHGEGAATEPGAIEDVNRELWVDHCCDGRMQIHWPVDARKLNGKDKQIISPSFEIYPGCSLKLMLKPTAMGEKKHQSSFKKAKGRGSVDLKLVESDGFSPTLRFCISVGGGSPRGPVEHDFSDSAVGGLAKNDGQFDFSSAVDPTSSTFLVLLEVLPRSA